MRINALKSLKLSLIFITSFFVNLTSQQQQNGILQQNVYQFLKSIQTVSRFAELIDRIASSSNDRSLISLLSAETSPISSSNQNGLTLFIPINEAFGQIPNDPDQLRNEIYNLISKDRMTLERLREMSGQNISRTFGYRPHLLIRVVKNFYSRIYSSEIKNNIKSSNQVFPNQMNPSISNRNPRQINSNPSQYTSTYPNFYQTPLGQTQYPGQNPYTSQTLYPGQQLNNQSDLSIYEMYSQIYGNIQNQPYDGPNISPKLAQDELILINNAIIIDKFELSNGIIYLLSSYPRYYEKSLLLLLQDNDVNGLTQNLNFWITRAVQSFRVGDENLKNALNAFGPNTYFLPTDQAFNKFNDREKLNNNTFLFDILFKSHRVSNQILFDYYLDESNPTYYTDTRLPVSTKHRRINGQDDIEISIGHVKGKIIPEFRNIYCASGIIHLVDTVLGVPTKTAYQEISNIPELSTFRAFIDRSTKYRQLLDQSPSQILYPTQPTYPQQRLQRQSQISRKQRQAQFTTQSYITQPYFSNDIQFMTILAPHDTALLGIKDEILKNDSAIDHILSAHIIVDKSNNRVFFTDHDDSIFQNSQVYYTLNPNFVLTANIQQDQTGVSNKVTFNSQSNPSSRTTIFNGNSRVSNGVVHVVDRSLVDYRDIDITSILDKYSTSNSPNSPAFNQFVDVLRSTGIFNDLRQPLKKYTLFIPTNEALSRYQDIVNSNDVEKKKQLIYRHICLDQNLQSTLLISNNQNQGYTTSYPNIANSINSNQQQYNNQEQNQLICRNALGQDLTLTKDSYGLISKWQGMVSSKILNDFSGSSSSAYLLDKPLLNNNLPNYGLSNLGRINNFDYFFFSLIFVSCKIVF